MTSEAAQTTADLPRIDTLLARLGQRRSGDATRLAAGTLNRNYRVPTEGTPLFARCYRADLDRGRIEREHAITRWVADRDLPAVAPLTLDHGATIEEIDGKRWALFPWIDGRNPTRGEIPPPEAEAMGDMHGRVQQALAAHPESDGRTLKSMRAELAWDSAASLDTLRHLETAATEAGAAPQTVAAIGFQRQLIEDGEGRPFSDVAWLPCQLLHGDFHDQQILLDAKSEVVAVVDWELTRIASRVWELLRSLSYSQLLEQEAAADYLRGFRRHVTLSESELRAGLDLWWQTRLHTSWVYEAYFLDGNERVGAFLETTDEHLRRSADDAWRAQLADRLVAAAAG